MSVYKKSVAVTGAARGLGFELVNQYSQDPSTLVFALVRDIKAATAVEQLNRSNVKLIAFDIVDLSSIKTGAEEVGKLSGGKLDILINNAGVNNGPVKLIDEKIDALRSLMDINVFGPIAAVQSLLPYLRAGKEKKIITYSSGLGSNEFLMSKDNIFPSAGAYNLSKGANVMTNTILAVELKEEGFIALAWSPGWVSSDMGNRSIPEGSGVVPPLNPTQSVSALIGKIDTLTAEDSGKLFGVFEPNGPVVPIPY